MLCSDLLHGVDVPGETRWCGRRRLQEALRRATGTKEQLARLLAWTAPTHNGRIKESFERLRQTDGDGNTVIRWRASFAAWAPAEIGAAMKELLAEEVPAQKVWGT